MKRCRQRGTAPKRDLGVHRCGVGLGIGTFRLVRAQSAHHGAGTVPPRLAQAPRDVVGTKGTVRCGEGHRVGALAALRGGYEAHFLAEGVDGARHTLFLPFGVLERSLRAGTAD